MDLSLYPAKMSGPNKNLGQSFPDRGNPISVTVNSVGTD
jgi:hypothetical protein